jgi:D-amino-acid dehydrogenase
LLTSFGRSDAALQVRLKALPSLTSWGVTFLRRSRSPAFEANALSNLRLAKYSLKVMESLRQQISIEYGHVARGALKKFRNPTSLEYASTAARRLVSEGLDFRQLSATETVNLEPALPPIASKLCGSLHYESDEIGDAHRFCLALADQARQIGVGFYLDTELSGLEVRAGSVRALVSRSERIVADHYVVAAGSFSIPDTTWGECPHSSAASERVLGQRRPRS